MEYSKFQFGKPRLLEIKYKINESFNPQSSMNLEAVSQTIVKRAKDKKEAQVILVIKIYSEEKLSEVPFTTEISMMGNFRWTDEMEEEMANKLLRA